jgi:hypothetical protein
MCVYVSVLLFPLIWGGGGGERPRFDETWYGYGASGRHFFFVLLSVSVFI